MNRIIPLIGAAALAVTLASCSSEAQGVAAVCVDPVSNMRVDDSLCGQHYLGFIPWYITAGYLIPAYGYPVAYGFAHQPSHTVIIQTPSSGGQIPRRGTFSRRTPPQTVQPNPASTQPPAPKKPSIWSRQKTTQTQKPVTQTAPRTQQKTQWQTYKPPTQSRPVAPRPPTYGKYR